MVNGVKNKVNARNNNVKKKIIINNNKLKQIKTNKCIDSCQI